MEEVSTLIRRHSSVANVTDMTGGVISVDKDQIIFIGKYYRRYGGNSICLLMLQL